MMEILLKIKVPASGCDGCPLNPKLSVCPFSEWENNIKSSKGRVVPGPECRKSREDAKSNKEG